MDEQPDIKGTIMLHPLDAVLNSIELDYTWSNHPYKMLANRLVTGMYPEYEPFLIEMAVRLWNMYSTASQPVVRKEGVVAAAVEYSIAQLFDLPVTKESLAEKYDVSVGSISKRVQEILDNEELMDAFAEEVNLLTSDSEPVQHPLEQIAKEYEKMLEHNPHDNQEIRGSLLSIYIELRQFEQALHLTETYDDNNAITNYSRVLIEYETNGPTAKAEQLLDAAIEQNPHVIDYLVDRKRLPRYELDSYTLGDDSEAVVYINENFHLWVIEPSLLRWVKKCVSSREVS
ncbi:tetratricopeptide repeat protein [Brevibacillus dissolubilis]|uniref:tetratricopeptide repeat protein n=1 Tax=Brevibacillus dissolubilis TaxID=1844116 RepID=UPI00159BB38B|nr:hypothetical protein [Brevibacillus dissolubilis]